MVALEHAFAILEFVNVLQDSMASDESSESNADTAAETTVIESTTDTATAVENSNDEQTPETPEEEAETKEAETSSSIYLNVHIHKPTVFLLQELSGMNPTAMALSADIKVACSLVGAGHGPHSGTQAKLLLQNVRAYRSSVMQYSPPPAHATDLLQPLQASLVRVCCLQRLRVVCCEARLIIALFGPQNVFAVEHGWKKVNIAHLSL